MAKQPKHGLMETKGQFQFKGVVNGVKRDDFFTNKLTKNNKDMNKIKFSLKTSENNNPRVSINGIEQDKVYFYKRPEKEGEKGKTKEVQWKNRKSFNEEGFQLIGVRLGLNKVQNDKGQLVNEKKTLVDYDACTYIQENLCDDLSVFVKGNIDYSSFKTDKGDLKRNLSFSPNQISLCKDDIDFKAEDFKEISNFQQQIIFMGIQPDKTNKEDKKYIISAKIVTFNNIEDAEFVIRNQTLAKTIKSKVKPYSAMKVWGDIHNFAQKEQVEEIDCWGEPNAFDQVGASYRQELEITGVDPKSIDTTIYSKEKIEDAIRVLTEFGDNNNEDIENEDEQWGESIDNEGFDEDEQW